ncbi:MAG: hypothetical protein R6V17_08095 [Halanaerobacter sp.]
MSHNYKEQGFSYLELLIIISIFGLLVILLVPTLIQTKNPAQEKETEEKIISDLEDIKLSLEKFHYDKGYYPVYNFPLPQQAITKSGTLKELIAHYPQLAKLEQKLVQPHKYYYYAPANANLKVKTPFYPSQKVLTDAPLKGAQQFILIYNSPQKYYKLSSYSSSLTIEEKKNTEKEKQLKRLFELHKTR